MNARREFLLATALLAAAPLLARAAGAPLKIATVGAGHIGSTLGGLWVKAGHPVMFSSRHPEELKDLVAGLGPLASAGSVEEALAFADVVLLAVPYRALPQIGKEFARPLAAKALVLDACNPFPSRDGEIATWARDKGAGLATAELLPGARLVRAFNAIGHSRLPGIALRKDGSTGMPIAGDDAKAIAVASGLIREIGLEPVLVGPLAMGRYLMPGTPLAGEHTPEEIRSIAAGLKP
ncbi:MAG: NADPH-dependent F420 reductase [Burkholderiales bacterium]